MIDYVPKDWLIESKALKFFLASFRNHSGFHEETTIAIGSRLAAVLEPV
jgi:7-cyano-7-deazaguanine reductase